MSTLVRKKKSLNHPPIANENGARGYMREFREDSLGTLGDLHEKFGDAIRIRFMGPLYGYLLKHPDHFKHVLQVNNRNYTKLPAPSFVLLTPAVGNGLLTSDGDFWLRQRRLAAPAFHRKRIADFGRIMGEAGEKMVERWGAKEGQTIDFAKEMHTVTFEIVGRTLFSIDLSAESDRVGQAVTDVSEKTIDLTTAPFSNITINIPFWPSTRDLKKSVAELDEVVYRIIEERRNDPEDKGDLLSMFMLTEDEETGERMDDKQLRDEVMTMMLAGHETTAVLLTWTMYLLAKNPDILANVRVEIDEKLGDKTPSMSDVANLPYIKQVLEETMRLYPPAYVMARFGNEPDVIHGYDLPKNSILTMSVFHLHRDPELWPNPEIFDPERFSAENKKGRDRFSYLPFGAGPRMCIGNIFALTEATILLAQMVRDFDFELPPNYEAEIEPLITIRPKGGLPLKLTKREQVISLV